MWDTTPLVRLTLAKTSCTLQTSCRVAGGLRAAGNSFWGARADTFSARAGDGRVDAIDTNRDGKIDARIVSIETVKSL